MSTGKNEQQNQSTALLKPDQCGLVKRSALQVGLLTNILEERMPEYWFKKGIAAKEAQKWEEAAFFFKRTFEISPSRYDCQLYYAFSSAQLGKTWETLKFVVSAAEGYIYIIKKWNAFRELLSVEEWQTFLAIISDNVQFRNYGQKRRYKLAVAIVLICFNEFKKAIESIEFIHSSYGRLQPFEILLMGLAYTKSKELLKAIDIYDQLLVVDPRLICTYNFRGLTNHALQNYDDAYLDFSNAIELDTTFIYAYANRARTRFHMKDYLGAISDYNEAEKLSPRDLEANMWPYRLRAESKYHIKDYKGAIADFDKAIELDPNNSWLFDARGVVHAYLCSYKEAINDFRKAISLGSKDVEKINLKIRLAEEKLKEMN